jgi:hypothetical protein
MKTYPLTQLWDRMQSAATKRGGRVWWKEEEYNEWKNLCDAGWSSSCVTAAEALI